METQKHLLKDKDGEEVDVHLYRSMIGSLMYLTSSKPDIMFVVSYTDSDYAGASLDRNPTEWKKQTMVANSTTETEYVAASSGCGQVLWIQNQLLDYGYNFMHTKIYIENESTICIVKNPVFHSKTKHIEIRHHFMRDSNEKKLIQMIKIHTDKNVADLLTKAFDNRIGVNAGDSKLMLLGINLLLRGKVNVVRHNLLLLVVKTVNGEQQLQALLDGKKIVVTEASVRRDLQLDDEEGSEVPTDPDHTPIITQPSSSQPQRKQKSKRPKEKDTQVPQSSVPSDPTNVVDEAVNSMQLKELMDFCTKLQQRVLDLENTKTAQAQEIRSLKKRVKKLEKKGGAEYNHNSTFNNTQSKSITFRDPDESTTRTTLTPIPSNIKDKGKSKMIKPEKPLKKTKQIRLDEELAFNAISWKEEKTSKTCKREG
ncbi:hypothetical protein Tco_0205425 [Tanacetum coccineum]